MRACQLDPASHYPRRRLMVLVQQATRADVFWLWMVSTALWFGSTMLAGSFRTEGSAFIDLGVIGLGLAWLVAMGIGIPSYRARKIERLAPGVWAYYRRVLRARPGRFR